MVKPSFVFKVQETFIPRCALTRTNEHCELDPRTLWWIWLGPSSAKAINSQCETALKNAGISPERCPLTRVDKWGRTAAETVLAQMELANQYLEFLMA